LALAEVPLPLLVALLLVVLKHPPRRRSRRRRRVRFTPHDSAHDAVLMSSTEKEESDEDMGFGLFD
jgi:hypothetical protein